MCRRRGVKVSLVRFWVSIIFLFVIFVWEVGIVNFFTDVKVEVYRFV